MKNLHIQATKKTPTVSLNSEGEIRIEGRSIPEDASLFFHEIIEWCKLYLTTHPPKTKVDIYFEYLNSGTSKYILQILKLLKENLGSDQELIVNWFYEEGDDDIMERGEYYASILEMDINFIETE